MPVRVCLTLTALFAALATAADWPQWRGRHRDAKSADTGLRWPAGGPKLLWKIEDPVKMGTGYGTPAVVGDRVYVLGGEPKEGAQAEAAEFLTCLNAADGSVVWRSPLGTSPGTFKLQGWGRGPRSTPSVDGDFVYCLGVVGDLACFRKSDGQRVWQKNLVRDLGGSTPTWGYSESPLVDGERVVCTPGGSGGMAALDKRTGEVAWQCKEFNHPTSYSSIVPTEVGGVRQYVQQTMEKAVGVRARDGKLLWQVGEIKRATAVIPTPVVADGYAFFTAGYGAGCELYKLEPDGPGDTKAELVYKSTDLMSNHHGGVVLVDGHLYGHTDHDMTGSLERKVGTWVCIPFKTDEGGPLWRSDKLEKGSVIYADGHLYCYGENKGTLVKVRATPEGWQEVGRFDLPVTSKLRPSSGKVWPHPVIANGKLYLRDYECLFCFDLGGPGA